MAMNMYIGGVDGLPKRVKKAYIGVGGVARPCWYSQLEYYGVLDNPLNVARQNLAATTVGRNRAIFAGGTNSSSSIVNTVDVYSHTLSHTTTEGLTDARDCLAATTVGSYALFGGGKISSSLPLGTVDAYTSSLTHKTFSAFESGTARYNLAATTANDIAVFAGGYDGTNYKVSVNMYNTTGTNLYLNGNIGALSLTVARDRLAATSIGNYALFGGGYQGNNISSDTIDVFDCSSCTQVSVPSTCKLSSARHQLAATSIGNYALFGGGVNNSLSTPDRANVDVFDSSLTRFRTTELSLARHSLSGTTVGDYAIFAGGRVSIGGLPTNTVDVFDESLVRVSSFVFTVPNLTYAKSNMAATTVGKYALFGGGIGNTLVVTNIIEGYVVP